MFSSRLKHGISKGSHGKSWQKCPSSSLLFGARTSVVDIDHKHPNCHTAHRRCRLSHRRPCRANSCKLFSWSTKPNAHHSSPILPKDFNGNQPTTIRLFPLSNYTFGTKEAQPEEDPSVAARLGRLQDHYEKHGMRRTCEGILVCHEHNHPHILMLQIANAFFKL